MKLTISVPFSCSAKFKLYVYDVHPVFTELQQQTRTNRTFHICSKCIYEQFALEYIIYDYFTQFCGRTYNPDEADFFYIPVIKDLQYRINLMTGNRASSPSEQALLHAIEKNDLSLLPSLLGITSQYWKRFNGSDHIIIMPAPVTNLRHQSNMRGFFHYMLQLHLPIFLNVEYSHTFLEEYPICAGVKNLVMPYPTTDPELYSGRYYIPGFPSHIRSKLLFYHGGNHGSCIHIRSALNQIVKLKEYAFQRGDRKREQGLQNAVFCPVPVGDSPSSKRMYDALHFGCIPVMLSDDVAWAYATGTFSGREHNLSAAMQPWQFSIQLPQLTVLRSPEALLQRYSQEQDYNYEGKVLPTSGHSLLSLMKQLATTNKTSYGNNKQNTLIQVLQLIPKEDILTLQQNALEASRHYLYYTHNTSIAAKAPPLTAFNTYPNGGAIHNLEAFLNRRKEEGVMTAALQCQNELKERKHKYIGNYPCEARRRRRRR